MSLIERIHGGYVQKRRVRVLRDHLVALIIMYPKKWTTE
jgi:hypothetical protein